MMTDGERMTAIASRMQTVNTVVTTVGGGWERIVLADPRRFYIQFSSASGSINGPGPTPGPIPSNLTADMAVNYPLAYKFHDCPALVQGEFYVLTFGATLFLVTEQIYVGD